MANDTSKHETDDGADRVLLKRRDFIARVAARSGLPQGEARDAVDAVLAAMSEAIGRGEDLLLPPFGKLMVKREKQTARGSVRSLRLVSRNPAETGAEPLAPSGEDG